MDFRGPVYFWEPRLRKNIRVSQNRTLRQIWRSDRVDPKNRSACDRSSNGPVLATLGHYARLRFATASLHVLTSGFTLSGCALKGSVRSR